MEEFLFVEKYRPQTIQDTILPDRLKKQFQQFVDKGEIPNLLLSGPAGVGKTTVARAMLEELGWDYIVINGSMNGDIDTLRTEIMAYVSTVSLIGTRKYVILDEADYLTAKTMASLRNFMEEYSGNAGFILTANFVSKIIEPLRSRCSGIEFTLQKDEKSVVAKGLYDRMIHILNTESIEYDKKVVQELVKKYFPDARRMLNEIQRFSISGPIDTRVISQQIDVNVHSLLKFMKAKDFKNVRKWIGENMDIETTILFRNFYDHAYSYFTPSTIPSACLALAKYQYQDALVADSEINRAACMVEIMVDCEFNDTV